MTWTGVAPEEIEDVYMGCGNQAGEDNRDVARMSLLLAGFPVKVAGVTVNRLCGSGLEAVASVARAIMLGEANEAYAAQSLAGVPNSAFGRLWQARNNLRLPAVKLRRFRERGKEE